MIADALVDLTQESPVRAPANGALAGKRARPEAHEAARASRESGSAYDIDDIENSVVSITLSRLPRSVSVDSWPKTLPAIAVKCVSSCKNVRASVAQENPLRVWHEIPAAHAVGKIAKAWNRSAHTSLAFLRGTDAELLQAEHSSDLEVRFGFDRACATSPTGRETVMVGRLPKDLAIPLSSLIPGGYLTATGMLVHSPEVLSVGSTITVWLQFRLDARCSKLMRFQAASTASAADAAAERFLSCAADMRARAALFEITFYCLKGVPAPRPSAAKTSTDPKRDAGGSTSPSMPEDEPAADGDAEAGADNAEERIASSDLARVVTPEAAASVPRGPALPLAEQPVGIRNLQLRPYQQQALAWMLARENEGEPQGSWPEVLLGPDGAPVKNPAAADAAVDSLVRAIVSDGGSSASASMASSGSLWEAYAFDDSTPLYMNPYTRALSLQPPPVARPCRGGILADEMGLGKTCEVVSLIVAQREKRLRPRRTVSPALASAADCDDDGEFRRKQRLRGRVPDSVMEDVLEEVPADDESKDRDEHSNLPRVRATLVVCPMSMMGQWQREIRKYTTRLHEDSDGSSIPRDGLVTLVEYGGARSRTADAWRDVDVVITSYGTLTSQYSAMLRTPPGMTPPAMYSVRWERVVLDEAHGIRNRQTRIARACTDLAARHRWCLTGTPIQNSLQDLYSLFRFLRHEPWSELLWWKRVIADPYERRDIRALQALQAVLRPVMLRRVKSMRDVDGTLIGDLPAPMIELVRLQLSEDERQFYDAIYKKTKTRFQGFVATGKILAQYAAIWSLLLRLRQACLHPYLVLASGTAVPSSAHTAAASTVDDDAAPLEEASFSAVFMQSLYQRLLTSAAAGRRAGSGKLALPSATPANDAPAADVHHHAFIVAQLEGLHALETSEHECPVCLDMLTRESGAILTCGHLACYHCALACTMSTKACPVCKKPLAASGVIRLVEPPSSTSPRATSPRATSPAEATTSASAGISAPITGLTRHALFTGDPAVPWIPSTKLSALTAHLTAVQAHNQAARRAAGSVGEDGAPEVYCSSVQGMVLEGFTRVVVFSSFTFMLDLVQRALRDAGIRHVSRLDGSMSQPQRESALAAFRNDEKVFVLLMSLKAGGVGLNLTEANIVYLTDPWWNPSTEHQALSRVHRLGQTKQVYVKRLIASDTIEDSMLEIQARKQKLASTALDGSGDGASAKLTEEDILILFKR